MSFEDQWLAEKSSDPRSNDELIQQLRALPAGSEEANDIYTILQARRDPEVIRRSQEMCRSANSEDRSIGAGILSQNGAGGQKILQKECIDTLLNLIMHDSDADVLSTAAVALDDYKDARIAPALAHLSSHPDSDVRGGVVWGLLSRSDESAVRAMIELSGDPDDDVRNWATFGLAQQIETDTPEIREALFRRLEDAESEIRAEGIVGLALRGDERVIDPLIRELQAIAKVDDYWNMVFEAAYELGDSRLSLELSELEADGIENHWFEMAIAACRIPEPEEANCTPDGADTTCPVCGLRNALPDPDNGFCARCGWQGNISQRADPDLAGRSNRRSLNSERERWQRRLEAARH